MSETSNIKEPPGTEEWSVKVRSRARKLVDSIDQGYMELAELIHWVWSTPIDGDPMKACVCVAWGYQNYTQWAEEELGLHKRKTERLKAIWDHLHITLGGKLERKTQRRLIALGWTKVRELTRVIDETNIEPWIEMAEHLNYQELCVAVRQALEEHEKNAVTDAVNPDAEEEEEEFKGAAPPPDIGRFREFRVYLTPEQKANIHLALDRAKELAASERNGHCLDLICTDFLGTNDFRKANDPDTALRFLAKFETHMDKRLVIINPHTWEIEYGMDTLSKAAEVLESMGNE